MFKIRKMIRFLRRRLGRHAAGEFIAILCDSIEKLTEDGDKNIRSIDIVYNDFYHTKFDFVKGHYVEE